MSESWHDYGFGICTSNLKEEISLPGLMELISQAPELKERVNTFINNECGGAFKDSYDILTSYVEQYGISHKKYKHPQCAEFNNARNVAMSELFMESGKVTGKDFERARAYYSKKNPGIIWEFVESKE
mgnify:CR=1 FL=1